MTERQEPTGGVRSQLRNLAMRGSFEGEWESQRAQIVRASREVSIPNDEPASLTVSLRAERFTPEAPRRTKLLTRYSLSAMVAYDELPPELVPDYVQFALKERNLQEWRDVVNEGREIIIVSSADDAESSDTVRQLIYEDAINIDDALFRFEREVTYTLDGRGQLLSEQRSDRFYDIDSTEAIADVAGTVDFYMHDGSIASWVEKATEPYPIDMELLTHPDLQKLEYKMSKVAVENFLKFAELVSWAEQDKTLASASRLARRQELLTLLAFLRYEAPASEIMKLVQ